MPYLDKAGTEELWSKIKSNFAHDITTSTLTSSGITISLNSGMKNSGNWVQLATANIPAATNTSGGLVTDAQAKSIASIQTYTAGTNISISGGQISVTGLATVATTGKYSDLTGTPTIDTSMSSTSTNAVTNAAISSALSGKANTSHTHTKSQITDFPTSLKNPNALTIGDVTYDGSAAKSITSLKNPNALTIGTGYNPHTSETEVTYDGSVAKSIMAVYGGVVIQQSWDYDDITTALDNSQTPVLKAFVDNAVTEPTWVYLFCTGLHERQNDNDTSSYMFSGMDLYGLIYFAECQEGGSVDDFVRRMQPLSADFAANTYLTKSTASSTYAPLASPTFTGTVTLPEISGTTSDDNTAATTAFVQAVVKASGAGTVHYKGAATSTASLVNYVTGDYWVASATFVLGDETVESGDMIFANETASAYAAANFDVVQANITAMTTAEVDAICTLD